MIGIPVNKFFGGVIATAIVAGIAWYFSGDLGINVPWSDKRIYHYDQCVKFEMKWHVCEPSKEKFAEYEKKLAELSERDKEAKTQEEKYRSLGDIIELKIDYDNSYDDYHDCKDVWLEKSPYPSKSLLEYPTDKPFADFMDRRCVTTEPKKLFVTIDVENQVVWQHNEEYGLDKYECEVLDKNGTDKLTDLRA